MLLLFLFKYLTGNVQYLILFQIYHPPCDIYCQSWSWYFLTDIRYYTVRHNCQSELLYWRILQYYHTILFLRKHSSIRRMIRLIESCILKYYIIYMFSYLHVCMQVCANAISCTVIIKLSMGFKWDTSIQVAYTYLAEQVPYPYLPVRLCFVSFNILWFRSCMCDSSVS